MDGGLLILSKFPILEQDRIIFSESAGADALASKGCLYALVELPKTSEQLHVFTTHTQSGEALPIERIRHGQIEELAKFVESKVADTKEDIPVLVAGDFNLDARNNYIHPVSPSSGAPHKTVRCSPGTSSDHYEFLIKTLQRPFTSLNRTVSNVMLAESPTEDDRHPVTNGKGHGVLYHGLLKDGGYESAHAHHGTPKCIDYIFFVAPTSTSVGLLQNSARIEECAIADLDPNLIGKSSHNELLPRITHLSDHFGISCVLEYRSGRAAEKPSAQTSSKLRSRRGSIDNNENDTSRHDPNQHRHISDTGHLGSPYKLPVVLTTLAIAICWLLLTIVHAALSLKS